MSTDPHEEVARYLTMMAGIWAQNRPRPELRYQSLEAMVAAEGVRLQTGEATFRGPFGRPKFCFQNAAERAFGDPRLTYCEGFAATVIATHHAWCIDADGLVVETTWKPHASGHRGQGYIGIPFPTEFLRQTIVATRVWGILESKQLLGIDVKPEEYRIAKFAPAPAGTAPQEAEAPLKPVRRRCRP